MVRIELHAVAKFDKKDKLRDINLCGRKLLPQYTSLPGYTTKIHIINGSFVLSTYSPDASLDDSLNAAPKATLAVLLTKFLFLFKNQECTKFI